MDSVIVVNRVGSVPYCSISSRRAFPRSGPEDCSYGIPTPAAVHSGRYPEF